MATDTNATVVRYTPMMDGTASLDVNGVEMSHLVGPGMVTAGADGVVWIGLPDAQLRIEAVKDAVAA